MKNTLYISLILIIFSFNSCAKNVYTTPLNLKELISSDQFTFRAERANPTNSDVINVMNSFPNGGGSQRFLNLDYGYIITLKNKELTVDLPYFGRLYTPNLNQDKNNFNFTTKNYTLSKSQNKKGDWDYKIVTTDQSTNVTINLEIYSNGKTYANLSAQDRQSISYDGYIMKNKVDKK
ncbi:DUF4251 domain-containing protein [Halpernia sp. GG3]